MLRNPAGHLVAQIGEMKAGLAPVQLAAGIVHFAVADQMNGGDCAHSCFSASVVYQNGTQLTELNHAFWAQFVHEMPPH